jgi:hypothetical protein
MLQENHAVCVGRFSTKENIQYSRVEQTKATEDKGQEEKGEEKRKEKRK